MIFFMTNFYSNKLTFVHVCSFQKTSVKKICNIISFFLENIL